MSVGMVTVIITGGIDLSVGSVMGLVGVVCGVLLQAGLSLVGGHRCRAARRAWPRARSTALLIAYAGLSPFVVTLGMLSFARSVAVVLSQNQMIYKFGPRRAGLQGDRRRQLDYLMGIARNPVWVLIVLAARRRPDPEVHDLGPLSLFDRRQRAGRAPDRRAGRPRQDAGLHHLRAHGGDLGDPDRRLAGIGDQRARHGLRAAGDRLDGDRRRQSHGRRGRHLRRLRRRGAARGHPQLAA